jgi:hypothetical protein
MSSQKNTNYYKEYSFFEMLEESSKFKFNSKIKPKENNNGK